MRGLGDMMRKAQQLQADMERAQAEIAALRIEGVAGGGAVRVQLTGEQRVIGVSLDPSLAGEALDVLEDLVAAATNDALAKLQAESRARMAEVSGGLPLPGLELPS